MLRDHQTCQVLLTGLGVTALFWKRLAALVYLMVLLCTSSGILCVISAILMVVNVILPLNVLSKCVYNNGKKQCECYQPAVRSESSFSEDEQNMLVFKSSSCSSIQHALPSLLYTLCGLYTGVLLLCVASVIIALLILRLERTKRIQDELDAYDEVFTVSGGSSGSLSDSDNEGSYLPGSQKVAPIQSVGSKQHLRDDKDAPYSGSVSGLLKTGNLKQTREPVTKTTSSKQKQALSASKHLSKSCDSLDDLQKREVTGVQNGNGSIVVGGRKGKLKEHRRRERRAVTLPNLDTKQLMLILDLQMRYLEETKRIDQSEQYIQRPDSQTRRSKTPNPPHVCKPSTMPRSHTPQPYKQPSYTSGHMTSNLPPDWHPKEIYQQIDKVRHRQQNRLADISNNFYENTEMGNIHPKSKKNRKQNSYNVYGNLDGSTYMVNHDRNPAVTSAVSLSETPQHHSVGPRSRPSVRDHFLPSEPLHRENDKRLPPKPISRQSVQKTCLPVKPTKRIVNPREEEIGHSAFQRVEPNKVVSERGSFDFTGSENFQLLPQQFLFGNEDRSEFHHRSDLSYAASSEPPPPYAPPPSYNHFLNRVRESEPCLHMTDHPYNQGRLMSQSSQTVSFLSPGGTPKSSLYKPAEFLRSFASTERYSNSQRPMMYENVENLEDSSPRHQPHLEEIYQQAKPQSRHTPRQIGDGASPSRVSLDQCNMYSQVRKKPNRQTTDHLPTHDMPENFYAQVNKRPKQVVSQNRQIDYENVAEQQVSVPNSESGGGSQGSDTTIALYEDIMTGKDKSSCEEEYYEDIMGSASTTSASSERNNCATTTNSPQRNNRSAVDGHCAVIETNGYSHCNGVGHREHVIDCSESSSGDEMESAI
ncbi:hypothetical protein ScPMuIL_002403 [Solemya velum]